jgi:hypothetical protein
MKGRVSLALAALAVLGAAFATSSFGLTSSLVVRSNATELDLHDKSQHLKLQAKRPIHVDIRFVTLAANEVIDWHGHAGPSLLVVKTGELTVLEPKRKGEIGRLTARELEATPGLAVSAPDRTACRIETYGPGEAFVHGEDAHSFRAGGEGAEFYIVYLLPEGALPAPIPMAAPAGCP